jgi:phage anti-repressor protein
MKTRLRKRSVTADCVGINPPDIYNSLLIKHRYKMLNYRKTDYGVIDNLYYVRVHLNYVAVCPGKSVDFTLKMDSTFSS